MGLSRRAVLAAALNTPLITLDRRALHGGFEATDAALVTDVIDLAGEEPLSTEANVSPVRITVDGPSAVKVQVRSGSAYFSQTNWTNWQDSLRGFTPVGRYCQLRVTLPPKERTSF